MISMRKLLSQMMDGFLNKPKLSLLVFGLFLVLEIASVVLILLYWNELQTQVYIQDNDTLGQVVFGNSLVLGVLRAFLIALSPIVAYLILAFSTRILFSPNLKIGNLIESSEQATDSLNNAEITIEKLSHKLETLTSDNETLLQENQSMRQMVTALAEKVVEISLKKKG